MLEASIQQFRQSPGRAHLTFLLFCCLVLPQRGTAQPDLSVVHFNSPRNFSIVVPVCVNGQGPYEFLLDTGSTATAIDPELLRSLKLDVIGGGTIATLSGEATNPLAVARTVTLGPVTAREVDVVMRDLSGLHELDPKIRGLVGQNVLKNADYLIDYRRKAIAFDSDGLLLAALDGKRVKTTRFETPGNPSYALIAVRIKLPGSAARDFSLAVDSGSASLMLFSDSLDPALLMKSPTVLVGDDAGHHRYVSAYQARLRVGDISRNMEAYIAAASFKEGALDGLLPTAGFGSVYISNSGGFVIFQPKWKRRPRSSRESIATVDPNIPKVLPPFEVPGAVRGGTNLSYRRR